jgi:hypothetical protein
MDSGVTCRDKIPAGLTNEMNAGHTIIWRRLDRPGHESARVFHRGCNWYLDGTAVFVHDGQPCRLDYLLECDSKWQTQAGRISGWVGNEIIDLSVSVDQEHRWRLSDTECAIVKDCIDLDLNFSPSTNLLPIRRLNLDVGQDATVLAAWLRFPSFRLEPLEQTYRRIDKSTYQYESAGGNFIAQLEVNDARLVTHYPNFWRVEDGS